MSYIQLPRGLKYDDDKTVRLAVPNSYKTDVLFSQLPYLAHIDHSVFKQRIEDLLKDSQGVQKFLLTTGDLNDSIQQSLNLVVGGDGKLNEGTNVGRLLDPKFPKNVMQNPIK